MMKFVDKNILITGGSAGIGLEIVKSLMRRGAQNIAVLDIVDNNNAIEKLRIENQNENVMFIKTDVASKQQVQSAFTKVADKFKFVDLVIANAGMMNEQDYERTIGVNLLGVMHTAYTAIQLMSITSGGRGGTVANISSIGGLDYMFSAPAYSASKYGVVGLTRCFGDSYYYKKHGLKFMTICPGFTDTKILLGQEGRLIAADTLKKTLKIQSHLAFQPASAVGEAMADILKEDKHGSIWMIDDGKYKEVTMPVYASVKK